MQILCCCMCVCAVAVIHGQEPALIESIESKMLINVQEATCFLVLATYTHSNTYYKDYYDYDYY